MNREVIIATLNNIAMEKPNERLDVKTKNAVQALVISYAYCISLGLTNEEIQERLANVVKKADES